MKIIRLEGNRGLDVSAGHIEIVMSGGEKLTLIEQHGELKIHSHHDVLIVKPCCANELTVHTYDN